MIKSQTFSSLTYQPIFMYLSNIIKVCHLICRQVYSGKIQLLMILDESIEGSRTFNRTGILESVKNFLESQHNYKRFIFVTLI